MSKYNVLLITIDTLRTDRLGCYGRKPTLTPNLDWLASQGIRFGQAITGGSWTQAAFPVLLTSTYASMYGGCMGPLSIERPSPIEALSKQGYATGAFVTSPLLGRSYGYNRGFEHFVELIPEDKDPALRHLRGGHYLLKFSITHRLAHLMGKQLRPARLYSTAEQVNNFVYEWLDSVTEPFFGWVHYMDVHWPYHLEKMNISSREVAQYWKDLEQMHRVNWREEKITPHMYDHFIDLYDKAVRYADAQVGKLLSYLKSKGVDSKTIVVIVSDHGEEFLERQHWGHVENNLFDEIVKVPLIIKLPESTKGQVVNYQVRTLDIMPTILDLCECQEPSTMEGSSLVPLWDGKQGDHNQRIAISERWRNVGDISHMVSVRTESHKYIWDYNLPDNPLLFDLVMDPGETTDLHKTYPKISSELHCIVEDILDKATAISSNEGAPEPVLDPSILIRLRDLGYLE